MTMPPRSVCCRTSNSATGWCAQNVASALAGRFWTKPAAAGTSGIELLKRLASRSQQRGSVPLLGAHVLLEIVREHYSIADIAVWPWYGGLVLGQLYSAAEFLSVQDYTHVQRWARAIAARPAVQRGRRVNRVWGDAAEQLAERHDASDFDAPPPAA